MEKRFEFKLVGMSFVKGYPDNLLGIHEKMENAKLDDLDWGGVSTRTTTQLRPGPLPLALFRNPENPHDSNAIEVHAPLLGRNGMMGHVPADLAARLAKSLDRGDEWNAWLDTVLVDPSHTDKPGALITVECVAIAPSAR